MMDGYLQNFIYKGYEALQLKQNTICNATEYNMQCKLQTLVNKGHKAMQLTQNSICKFD